MQFIRARQFIMAKLRRELPRQLFYHSAGHIVDVYDAAERIGKSEKLTSYEMKLLLTAASYHDSGFLSGARQHEEASCEIARNVLPDYGYTAAETERICGMIMATKLPQSPRNHLEEVLADADLDYLGREDFFSTGNQLFKELSSAGMVQNEDEWNLMQMRFLENHHYFTQTALATREAIKQQHLAEVKAKLK